MLSAAELARYNRQLLLPELGIPGQERLKSARVLVVGAGGLGSPASLYLAAAGVGTIGIADSDEVAPSNLHRQVLHGHADLGKAKTLSAAESLRRLNPEVVVEQHTTRLDARNIEGIAAGYDLVVDGSDNYPTRYAVNDACVRLGRPWVYGSVERFSGQLSVFGYGDSGPCYRCAFPEPPAAGSSPNCDEIGVLGSVAGVIGTLQATEALKIIAGLGEPVSGRLLQVDFLRGNTRWIRLDRRPGCPACGTRQVRTMAADARSPELPAYNIDPRDVTERLRAGGARLLDIREPWEVQRARIGDALELPMSTLEDRLGSLSRDEELIVFCHHGSRSRVVTDFLRAQGFRARNMTGGIDRWSSEVDPTVPRY